MGILACQNINSLNQAPKEPARKDGIGKGCNPCAIGNSGSPFGPEREQVYIDSNQQVAICSKIGSGTRLDKIIQNRQRPYPSYNSRVSIKW
jgi:hypothetical protein